MKILSLIIILTSILPIFFLWRNDIVNAGLSCFVPLSFFAVILAFRMRRRAGKLDMLLVTAILHMYSVSLGESGPSEIIDAVADTAEYKYYSRIFRVIRDLTLHMGHGLTKSLSQVAKTVKPPLKDILIRMTEAFSATNPKDFLELEASTVMEEYSGYYSRALESLRVLGGVFSTFQSVSVFIVLTVLIMTIFMTDPSVIPSAYALALISTAAILLAFKVISPKDLMVHLEGFEFSKYKLFRFSLILIPVAFLLFIFIFYFLGNPGLGLMVCGGVLLLPGYFAYDVERTVMSYDEYYPSFIKSLGENLSSTLNLKNALEYATHIHLGPFEKLVRHALSWVKFGINYEKSLRLMACESASHLIYMFNKILTDSLRSGSPPLMVSKVLANASIRFLEFRKRRLSAAKNVEITMLLLQPITVFILVSIVRLCGFFTGILKPLPYLPFNVIPVDLIEMGNVFLVLILSFLNSLAVIQVKGGFNWTFILYMAILLLISGLMWYAAEFLALYIFPQFSLDFSGGLP